MKKSGVVIVLEKVGGIGVMHQWQLAHKRPDSHATFPRYGRLEVGSGKWEVGEKHKGGPIRRKRNYLEGSNDTKYWYQVCYILILLLYSNQS